MGKHLESLGFKETSNHTHMWTDFYFIRVHLYSCNIHYSIIPVKDFQYNT